MSVTVYINFNGNCREATAFYAKVFETENPHLMTYGDLPPNPDYPLPEEAKQLVMNTSLNINGSTIMFSDVLPDMSFTKGNNISIVLNSSSMDEIKSIFTKLSENGKIDMELQETFWSKLYGTLTDQFGITWQLNYENGEQA